MNARAVLTECSNECFCANSISPPGGPAPNGEGCNMACSGAPGEACGGPNRLSLYERAAASSSQSSASTSTAATAASILVSTSSINPAATSGTKLGWSYEGCYVDGPGPRTLPNGVGVQGGMTRQKCLDACQAGGYVLAGTEYAGECSYQVPCTRCTN